MSEHRRGGGGLYGTLADGRVDFARPAAVITDPPYNSGAGSMAARVGQSARSKYVPSDAQHTPPDFDGDQCDQRGFLPWVTLVMGQCWRVTRTGGPLLVFCDFRQVPVTSDALQAGCGVASSRGTSRSPARS